MVVQHNISAMTANRYYTNNNSALGKSMEKLSSGLAINRAGDNAAGLAVSEKMRAQISGLTQASKNAQDGISMVQTFEGALQETDSILQRMRTLAVQSANGSYADDVDRDAIQLEFNQLNDELNQIADTDYNGVVVLNGGIMADGLEAVDTAGNSVAGKDSGGKFDYGAAAEKAKDAYDQKVSDYNIDKALYDQQISDENKAVAASKHFCGDADAAANNIIDGHNYGKTEADKLWDTLGIDVASDSTKDDPDELTVTFTYDGNDWKATGVSDKAGNAVKVDQDKLDLITTTATENGGFTIEADGTELGNAIFDTSSAKTYDTATFKFTNMAGTKAAPTNTGLAEGGYSVGDLLTNAGFTAPTFEVSDTVFTDDTMDEEKAAILDALNGAEFKGTYASGGKTGQVALQTGSSIDVKIGDTKIGSLSVDANSGTIKWTKDSTNNPNSAIADNTEIGQITLNQTANNVTGTASGDNNVVKFKLNMDSYSFVDDKGAYTASSVGTVDPNSKPTAFMFAAEDEIPKEPEVPEEVAKAAGDVSTSNAFYQSKAKLTYANNMTLQTGARTKDAVTFAFSYSTGDLGGLQANMNCSAREGGLETAKLSLKTQAEANDAIDKIDKAINKVSMVRGTFGAIQNRLEHKISNLDTNAENVTAAESRIRDTQMDQEMMKFTSAQILSQASQSMLAQANSLPQGVLQLLG